MSSLIPPYLYHSFYVAVMSVLVLIQFRLYQLSPNQIVNKNRTSSDEIGALCLSIILIIFFGFRNPFSEYFSDTVGYAGRYFAIEQLGKTSVWFHIASESKEFIWNKLLILFALNHLEVSLWLTTIAAIYIGGEYFTIKKFFPNNIFLGCLFAFLNFGFYGGAVNGIRNAAALSLILIALYYITRRDIKWVKVLCLMIIGYFIHTSVALPAICMVTARFIIKSPSFAFKFWFFSIIVSLVAGDYVSGIFQNLGFDDRLTSYLAGGKIYGRFRWDFLIFSSVPVFWGWYIIRKLNINDFVYNIIYITYVLANSFWVMIIKASFSNRFAALSWFLYFLVLSYPLLKFKLFPNQGQVIFLSLLFLLFITIFI